MDSTEQDIKKNSALRFFSKVLSCHHPVVVGYDAMGVNLPTCQSSQLCKVQQ